MERETGCHNWRTATARAMTGNGDNDTPAQSQPNAMRAADGEPAGGESPVELVRYQPFDDFPVAIRGVEDKWDRFQNVPGGRSICHLAIYIGSIRCRKYKGGFPVNSMYLRGDIYLADLGQGIGSEQLGNRPVLIVQNNIGNKHSPTVIVAPITSRTKQRGKQPTQYYLNAEFGLTSPSVVLLEQLRTIDKQRLSGYIGHLDDTNIQKLNRALAISVGLIEPNSAPLTLCLCHSCVSSFFETGSYYIKRANPLDVETDICTYCNRKRGYDYLIREKLQH